MGNRAFRFCAKGGLKLTRNYDRKESSYKDALLTPYGEMDKILYSFHPVSISQLQPPQNRAQSRRILHESKSVHFCAKRGPFLDLINGLARCAARLSSDRGYS